MVTRLIAVLTMAVVAMGLVGCAQQPPASTAPPTTPTVAGVPLATITNENLPRLHLASQVLPKGSISMVAAMGDSLVVLSGKGTDDSLDLFTNGAIADHIATRPSNHIFSFAADDRWFVWAESKEDAGQSQNDQWGIWAWNRSTKQTTKVAEASATAKEMGLPGGVQIDFKVKISDGVLVWASFDPTPSGTRIRLHAYNLESKELKVLAETDKEDGALHSYDIHGKRIAYRMHGQVIVETDGQKEVLEAGSQLGSVAITLDAVVWTDGFKKLFFHNQAGTRELVTTSHSRWDFTSTDHYLSWWEDEVDSVHLLDTSKGQEFVVEGAKGQGGIVSGRYVGFVEAYKLP